MNPGTAFMILYFLASILSAMVEPPLSLPVIVFVSVVVGGVGAIIELTDQNE